MPASMFKFKQTALSNEFQREYEVRDGGVLLGTVKQFERRYNLRRVYVSRGWRATAPDGTKLYEPRSGPTGERREDAAIALQLYHDGIYEGVRT